MESLVRIVRKSSDNNNKLTEVINVAVRPKCPKINIEQQNNGENNGKKIIREEMLSSSLMRVFFLLQLIVISIQGFHHKREISSFEQFVEIFPEYQYCRKSELINVNENLRKSKERECLERQARFNLQLHEIRDHNALNLTWKKGERSDRSYFSPSIYFIITMHIYIYMTIQR